MQAWRRGIPNRSGWLAAWFFFLTGMIPVLDFDPSLSLLFFFNCPPPPISYKSQFFQRPALLNYFLTYSYSYSPPPNLPYHTIHTIHTIRTIRIIPPTALSTFILFENPNMNINPIQTSTCALLNYSIDWQKHIHNIHITYTYIYIFFGLFVSLPPICSSLLCLPKKKPLPYIPFPKQKIYI